MRRNVLRGSLLLLLLLQLRQLRRRGRTRGVHALLHRSDGDLVEHVDILLVAMRHTAFSRSQLHAVELVDVEAVVDLHAREARGHHQVAAVGRPLAARDVLRLELHHALALVVVPDVDVAAQVAEALRLTAHSLAHAQQQQAVVRRPADRVHVQLAAAALLLALLRREATH